ncbi:MAG: endonuclease/exonuclease/phosphatase family protein [Bacteroidota bacterium]
MVTKLFNYKSVQWGLSLLIIAGALICIFTPNYFLFKMGASFAIHIMLSYLVLGIFFLIIRQPRLMFTSFACCAGLCMFLKYASNADLRLPAQTSNAVFKIAHFNVSASDENNYEGMINSILDAEADLVSIQEVTPDWDVQFKEQLSREYPYSSTIVRFDPYGQAIYSKFPLQLVDTFYYKDIPNLIGSFRPSGMSRKIYFISSHTTPPLFSNAYEDLRQHLRQIAEYANRIKEPLLTFGDYYAPPWWAEIQNLKEAANLNDSRRSTQVDVNAFLQNPIDYIFHSSHFECVGFSTITTDSSSHLGISGTYQFNSQYFNPELSNAKAALK